MNIVERAASISTNQGLFDEQIPVIDMQNLHSSSSIHMLKQAFQKFGFVAIVNAHTDMAILDQAYDSAKSFFRQPLDKKREIKSATNSGERGYVDTESPKGQNTTTTDFKEFIHMGRELTEEQKRTLSYPENLWPKDFNLQGPMMELFRSLEMLVEPFSEAIAQAADLQPSIICDMTKGGDHLLRAVHYPANPPNGEDWAAEHTDITLFTILPKATEEGLQLQLADGKWIDVTVPENAIVVNVGDMLQNLTNGLFRSSIHRVKSKKQGVERFSIVFFVHAHRSDKMDPLHTCIEATGGIRKYPNATRQQLLEQRIVEMGRGSYEMMESLSRSGLLEEELHLGRDCTKALKILRENLIKVVIFLMLIAKGPLFASKIDDTNASEKVGLFVRHLKICHQDEWRNMTVSLEYDTDAMDKTTDVQKIREHIRSFLESYDNRVDFWEVMNKKLIHSLLKEFPTIKTILSRLSLAPDRTLYFPRESIVEYTQGKEVLKEIFTFTKLKYLVCNTTFQSLDFNIAYEFKALPAPSDYPDYRSVDERIEQFFSKNPVSVATWRSLKPLLEAFLLKQFPSFASVEVNVKAAA